MKHDPLDYRVQRTGPYESPSTALSSTKLKLKPREVFPSNQTHSHILVFEELTVSLYPSTPLSQISYVVVMGPSGGATSKDKVLYPVIEPPPRAVLVPVQAQPGRYTHRSLGTLLVVLAVITLIGVAAGVIARLCGGRHFGGNGENDIEGWVERKCRSCIDAGVPASAEPETPQPQDPKPEQPNK